MGGDKVEWARKAIRKGFNSKFVRDGKIILILSDLTNLKGYEGKVLCWGQYFCGGCFLSALGL